MLNPKGVVGKAELIILIDATAIMLAVVIPVIVLTLGFVWWFRSENARAIYRPEWEYSGSLEVVVWCIPALIILFLGGIAWISSHDLDPPAPLASPGETLNVEVVSMDWKWLFIYPDQGVASLNHLVIPAGNAVHFRLTSASVMNSFFIPQLGGQIYTMNGMTTQLNLRADEPGTYQGLSAQFSGDNFSDMRFLVDAVTPDAFQGWISSVKGTGASLNSQTYRELVQARGTGIPTTFGQIQGDLFEKLSEGDSAFCSLPIR